MTEFVDKRHNLGKVHGDKALDEINYFLEQYRKAVLRFYPKHKLTRRLSLYSLFWVVFSLVLLYSKNLFSVDLTSIYPVSRSGFDVVNWQLIVFWPAAIIFFCIDSFGKFLKTIFIIQSIILSILFSKETVAIFCAISMAIFVVSYATNKMLGFTRAWSRNRNMVCHLSRLKREHELAIEHANEIDIAIEQENTLTKLFSLEESNLNAAHKDIVGDYFAVGDGALGWLKGFKK